jgi:hypothetical protein
MDQVGSILADVARILLQDKSGKQLSFGSGRLIGRDLIVTARHVLETADGQQLDDQGWEVRLLGDREGENWSGEPIPAAVVRRVPRPVDLALLKLKGAASHSPSEAFRLRLARYDQESDLAGIWFAGFPNAAREKETCALEYGTPANLRWAADKALRRMRVTVAAANTPKENLDWSGCSGGVVLFRQRDTLFLLGVLVQVPRAFSGSLDAVPIVEGLADKQFHDLLSERVRLILATYSSLSGSRGLMRFTASTHTRRRNLSSRRP